MPRRKRVASLTVSPAARFRAPVTPAGTAANDNGTDRDNDALLRCALRMFATHGLGAAHRAQKTAEAAFFSGDRAAYRWWLAVTRTLDRKLAVELCGRMGSELFGTQSLHKG